MGERSVVIIGSGPAGYTAAIYAARAALNPLLISGLQPGGQLTITSEVENFPGFINPIQGAELMDNMRAQAIRLGVEIVDGIVDSVDLIKRPFSIETGSNVIKSKSIILATGASARWLGLPSEKRLMGKGVSGCATCDGPFYRNQDVVVVGGGDTAIEEAQFLTKFASSVTVIHRRDKLRASQILQRHAFQNPKIKFEWDSVVKDILGKDGVEGVSVENVKTHEVKELKCTGVFVAIGHTPNTALLKGQLKLDENGYIVTKPGSTVTSVDGVFAAGDCQDPKYRQAVVAAGSGSMAAIDADSFLECEKDK